MKLSPEDLRILHDEACAIARDAGELIASYAQQGFAVSYKEGGCSLASQVVTEVDHKSDELIIDRLQENMSRYDIGLLTEEREDDGSRFEKDYFWCIDPLDGTLAFTRSVAGYAVSIALVSKDGESQIGVVYDPLAEVMYSAVIGQGAWRNACAWQLPENESIDELTVPVDHSLDERADFSDIFASVRKWAKRQGYRDLRRIDDAGSVMSAIWVLDSGLGCYFKFPKAKQGGGSIWDFAATACIYKELEAHVTDSHGQALVLNPTDTTFMNEKGVLFSTDVNANALIQTLIDSYSEGET